MRFHLERNRSLLMLAPRRVGKTWLMDEFQKDMAKAGWLAIKCDVEGLTTETEFLTELCKRIEAMVQEKDGISQRVQGRIQQLLGQLAAGGIVNWREALKATEWPSFADTLVSRLNDQEHDTVILVDELALFVAALVRRDPEAAKTFLYRLRNLVQAYPRVRWVLTGSIGLDVIAKQAGIGGALLGLDIFPLQPFSAAAALSFIEHLCASGAVLAPFELDEGVGRHLIDQLGWLSPYYLVHLASLMRPTGPTGASGRPLATREDVDRAFDVLLSPTYRQYFVAWEEHLQKNFAPSQAEPMRVVLDTCCRRPEGESIDTLLATMSVPPHGLSRSDLRSLLDVLETDGYLERREVGGVARFRFRSGLLRRYWERFHAN